MKTDRSMRLMIAAAALVLSAGTSGRADAEGVRELAGARGPSTVAESTSERAVPYRLFRNLPVSAIHRLGPLDSAERIVLEGTSGLESGSEATRVGIVRSLPSPVELRVAGSSSLEKAVRGVAGGHFATTSDGRMIWTSGFASEGAGAIRLLLEDVVMPVGAVAFVYGPDGETHGPYAIGSEAPRSIWTNTVFDDQIFLEVQLPEGVASGVVMSLSVASIAHLEHGWFAPSRSQPRAVAEALAECFDDLSCVSRNDVPGLDDASRAVAQISYREGAGVYVCSGGLLNTTAGTATPYFLTANHCVGDGEVAASVEAFWDYRSPSCGGSPVARGGLARTLGATLLATGSKAKGKGDFNLLRLDQQPPAGRYYLGWSASLEAIADGATLHRIAHPDGGPQSYSEHKVSATPTPGACDGLPTTRFIYSKALEGATQGGSSGAPAFLGDGLKVVGQLFGRCGRNLDDTCDVASNSTVDGAFASYFEEVRVWLDPPKKGRCNPTAMALCLTGGKFRVEVLARDPRTGRGAKGTAFHQNDVFGYFSLPELTGQSENPEVFVKIVDGNALNGRYWVFYGGLTDLEIVLEVTDMDTGVKKVYSKDAGGYCGDSDTAAF